jgi:hypothetical protein
MRYSSLACLTCQRITDAKRAAEDLRSKQSGRPDFDARWAGRSVFFRRYVASDGPVTYVSTLKEVGCK